MDILTSEIPAKQFVKVRTRCLSLNLSIPAKQGLIFALFKTKILLVSH